MKNEKYYVIEKEILEKLLKEMCDKYDDSDNSLDDRWIVGNYHALKTVLQYCKPLDETTTIFSNLKNH